MATTSTNPTRASSVPRLENGDRLTRAEFERRFDAMPDLKKAELIEGIVYLGSPVRHEGHGKPHFHLIGWLSPYCNATPNVKGGDSSSLRLDLDNMLQPDVLLSILPDAGGQMRVSQDDYAEGAPELIAEVASSSVSHELHAKFHVYRRNGVKEYVVWRVQDRAIDWFVNRAGAFERLPLGSDGIYRSETLPGLWLDPRALIDGDWTVLDRVSRQGLDSSEHAAFMARLREESGRRRA